LAIDGLQNLSLSDLLSAPLVAAIDASFHAQTETVRLLQEVGYDEKGELRTVSFSYETPAPDAEDGEKRTSRRQLEIPLLLFLSVPNLQVSEIEEKFSARITQVDKPNQETTTTKEFLPSRLIVTPAQRSTTLDRPSQSRFHLEMRMVAELQNESIGMELLERAANAAVTEREEPDRNRTDGLGVTDGSAASDQREDRSVADRERREIADTE
jgi:hypothetical protein